LSSSLRRLFVFPVFRFLFSPRIIVGQDPGIFFVTRPDGRAALTKGGSYGRPATLVPPYIGLFQKKCDLHGIWHERMMEGKELGQDRRTRGFFDGRPYLGIIDYPISKSTFFLTGAP
jgi:hypothetical protein